MRGSMVSAERGSAVGWVEQEIGNLISRDSPPNVRIMQEAIVKAMRSSRRGG
jgi:hypothetical protein